MMTRMRTLLEAFRRPVRRETRANLQRLWAELPAALRTPEQLVGKQWEGCGATVGAMPRCDFGCTACYLGSEANRTPALSLEELTAQLALIRERVGWRGNVQLTDGEVSLRDADEVVQLIRSARGLELIPMLMSHGDTFRRDPDLLERLVLEGGLTEVCFHVDTTQRGRAGVDSVHPVPASLAERTLDPVRSELAEIARRTRARTGRDLRVANTVTVTADNLDGVPDIVRWTLDNADVVRVLSFQPVADVGRTRSKDGVDRARLWNAVARGLGEDPADARAAYASAQLFGHPECSHVVMGAVWRVPDERPRFVPLRDPTDPRSESDLSAFFERFGGLSFREDGRSEALARGLGVLARAPGFWLGRGPGFFLRWLRRLDPERPLRAFLRWASGRAKLTPLALVSHHFMDRSELETPLGRERESACVFRVPFRGELVSMCRMNAAGLRDELYAELGADAAGASPASPPASPSATPSATPFVPPPATPATGAQVQAR